MTLKRGLYSVFCAAVVACATAGLKADSGPSAFTGTWHNELGSTMDITVDSAGAVHGTYRSCAGEGDHSAKNVVGFAQGDTIGFVVFFNDVGTITTWSGHFGGGQIKTLWHLGYSGSSDAWKRTWAGADNFISGPSASCPLTAPKP